MNKIYKPTALWMMCLMLFSSFLFLACDNGDYENTNQYSGGIKLNVFGPSPVARGGVLRFLGSGLDRVTGIEIPGCAEITEIEVISNTEIRITVPQTAEPGLVTLHTPVGDIVTKTELNYTEPIALETFAPTEIKPGNVLTITGEYLNLIGEVIFANEIIVPADEFVSHSRKEIKVIVPYEAQTGKFILSDGAEIPNWIYSDEELKVTLPSVEEPLERTGKKPGETLVIAGKDFDLVEKVEMPDGSVVEFELATTEAGETISFVLPENMTDGAIVIIPASGVKVVVANIGMAIPAEVVVTPAISIRSGDELVLTGLNMELVTTVTFPGIEEPVEISSQTATEVKVVMPAEATSGEMLLNTNSGTSVPVTIETEKPTFTGYASAEVPLGADVTIMGENLDLVTKVVFTGGGEVTVQPASSTEITVTMPTMMVETGVLTLIMANGETVEIDVLTINEPEFCYIPVLPGEDEELRGGELLTVTVANGERLTGVEVNSNSSQYVLTGTIHWFA